MPRADGETVLETVAGEDAESYVGLKLDPTRSKSARVLERGRSERVDSLIDDPEVDQHAARSMAARTGLFVPLIVRDRAIGVIVAQDKQQTDPRFTDEDVRIAEAFAERAAVAIDLSERVASDALRRVVTGQELERQRLARELHDETGQALTSILLGLKRSWASGCGFAAARSVSALMTHRRMRPTFRAMGPSYAVSWKDSEGSSESGRLELGPQGLHLEGAVTLDFAYGDLTAVSIGRGPADRLGGRTTVVLSRRNRELLWIAPVAQHAALLELYDRVSAHVRKR
jgi:GAF domain/Histidine kinase